jgi:hypothetical protein
VGNQLIFLQREHALLLGLPRACLGKSIFENHCLGRSAKENLEREKREGVYYAPPRTRLTKVYIDAA